MRNAYQGGKAEGRRSAANLVLASCAIAAAIGWESHHLSNRHPRRVRMATAVVTIEAKVFVPVVYGSTPGAVGTPSPTAVRATASATPAWPEPTPRPGPVNPTSPPEPFPPEDVFAGCRVIEDWDYGDNAVIDRRDITTYNQNSDVLILETDDGADGEVDFVSTRTYDGDRLTQLTTDHGNDGLIDYVETYAYASSGALVGLEVRNADNVLLYKRTYVYDEKGRRVREDLARDEAEVPVHSRYYEYDVEDHLIRETEDEGADGEIDYAHINLWQDDVIARVDHYSRTGGAMVLERSVHLAYDSHRRLLRRDSDTGGDGEVDRTSLYSYEAHGWVEQKERFRKGDLEDVTSYSYDRLGRITVMRYRGPLYVLEVRAASDCP